jgi:hypothetical protein
MTSVEVREGYKRAEEELRREFPHLFNRCDSLACPPGWYNLVLALCQRVESLEPEARVDQLKPKCSSLRFYTGPIGESVKAVIREAEAIAAVTCQNCGAAGMGRGWDVLCDGCEVSK